MSKHTLMKGTLILTSAGLLTRILGFFYRIWLSARLGAELVGIYQLIFPVFGICFTLYASGIQTAISKLAAEADRFLPNTVLKHRAQAEADAARLVLRTGFLLSFLLSLLLSLLVYEGAPFLAAHFLFEPRATGALRLMSFLFPFGSISACINGYYYGRSRSGVPACTQLVEQVVRIGSVWLLVNRLGSRAISCELAVLGLLFGEAASALFNLCAFSLEAARSGRGNRRAAQKAAGGTCSRDATRPTRSAILSVAGEKSILSEIGLLALPLSFNRLVVSLLHSLEATMVPVMLRKAGLSSADALSRYGILNGMSLPFLHFPTAITSALSILLLPTVAQASRRGQTALLHDTIYKSQKFSLLLGCLCTALFLIFGRDLGGTVFGEPLAGRYLVTLSWLCPFLYVSSTFNSVLNGLGKPYQTFLNSVVSLCIRIVILLFAVPRLGMFGYFLSLLVSQIAMTLMDGILLFRIVGSACLPDGYLVKTGLLLALLGAIVCPLYEYGKGNFPSPYLALLCYGGAYVLCALLLFFLSHIVTLQELPLPQRKKACAPGTFSR